MGYYDLRDLRIAPSFTLRHSIAVVWGDDFLSVMESTVKDAVQHIVHFFFLLAVWSVAHALPLSLYYSSYPPFPSSILSLLAFIMSPAPPTAAQTIRSVCIFCGSSEGTNPIFVEKAKGRFLVPKVAG